MADPQFDELNAITRFEMYPRIMEDLFFKGAPYLAYMRKSGVVPFTGGSGMRSAFLFSPLIGGPYSPGDNFVLTKVPVVAAHQLKPRYYYVAVPEYKEVLQVENVGPLAVFSLLDADMRAAMNTLNAMIAIAMWREGTSAGRAKQMSGLAEAINNGVDPSWDGTIATSYAGQLRNGAVGSALNSTPMWLGDALGNPGSIQYHHLIESYQDASIGSDEPDLGICNKAAFAYILERMQVQQRFMESMERDPIFGATGFRFMNARIIKDEYAPSLAYGESHAILGSNLTATVASPASPTAKSRIPGSQTLTIGEVFMWMNSRAGKMRVASSEEYAFGWSGFFPSQRSTRVVGHFKAGLNYHQYAPRLNKMLFGFTS
jgi:hypothetical protein